MPAEIIKVEQLGGTISRVHIQFNNKGKVYTYSDTLLTQSELQRMVGIQKRGHGGLTRFMQGKNIMSRNDK